MLNDDTPIGSLLSRREMLALLGVSGAALVTGAGFGPPRAGQRSLPDCVVRPAQTEGPYFVDERLHRSDIRTDPSNGVVCAGTPLALTFYVSRVVAGACQPLSGAEVHVWQCDAGGVYSDVVDPGFDTRGRQFLRGHQVSDADGRVTFQTIYPGAYPQRAVHIHFKVLAKDASGTLTDFTSQLYFDDALTDRVHRAAAYADKARGRRRNPDDSIYRQAGDQLILRPTPVGAGYQGTFSVGLRLG